MGLRVSLTPRASADLDNIRDYLVERNPIAAERVRQSIDRTVDLLAGFPHIGRRTHLSDVRVAKVPRSPYLVYYLASDREVIILHIRHGVRKSPAAGEF